MEIVRQLMKWMVTSGRLSQEEYLRVKTAILGETVQPHEERWLEECFGGGFDRTVDTWWRFGEEKARRRGGGSRGGKKPPRGKAVKVWDLEPKLPALLTPLAAKFPLARLLAAVGLAARLREATADWTAFSEVVSKLYKMDAEDLHAAFYEAVRGNPVEVCQLLFALESGLSLFPEDFLAGLSGESVDNLRARLAGEAGSFVNDNRKDWLLQYENFNVLNEACLVRNRLRRIFRLWLAEGAQVAIGCEKNFSLLMPLWEGSSAALRGGWRPHRP